MATQLFAPGGRGLARENFAFFEAAGHVPEDDWRRILNVFAAVVGLIITTPLMIAIAVLIKLTSRGPVLYKQARIGIDRRSPFRPDGNQRRHKNLGGAPFTMYKFRTMRVDSGSAQVWAKPGDSRVTPIGRVLRKLRLDEIPQLYNVLRGEMNVVGPRPEQPDIFGKLREQIGAYPKRQRVLPGITGWAQINHSYDRSIDDVRVKVAFDLEYISRRSAFEDAKIMFYTLPVMLERKSGW